MDKEEKIAEVTYIALTTADMLQTLQFKEKNLDEMNPFLGVHPSKTKICIMIPLAMLAHIYIADLLPAKWRGRWQYIFIGIEAAAVNHNYKLGVRIKF